MNRDGEVEEWLERIILGTLPLEGQPAKITVDEPPQTPSIEIDVKRRRA
jgi:hypothetical protein